MTWYNTSLYFFNVRRSTYFLNVRSSTVVYLAWGVMYTSDLTSTYTYAAARSRKKAIWGRPTKNYCASWDYGSGFLWTIDGLPLAVHSQSWYLATQDIVFPGIIYHVHDE